MTTISIPSSEIIQSFVKGVFGTFFIEPDNWIFSSPSEEIGRTYFKDRCKLKNAINQKTVDNIYKLYLLALTGKSSYDPTTVSWNIASAIKQTFCINLDYLMFFDDDTERLRKEKIRMILIFTHTLLFRIIDMSVFVRSDEDRTKDYLSLKFIGALHFFAQGTYTEQVINFILSENHAHRDQSS